MKNLLLNLALLLMAVLGIATSCNTYKRHVTSAYYQKAGPNTKLAIIPVQFHLNGPITNRYGKEKLIQLQEKEGYRFQTQLANHIITKMGRRKRRISVDLQDINTTNKLLKKSGYTPDESAQLEATELGKILGVDAVMFVDIESSQLFTNFESEAIKTGAYVLEAVLGQNQQVNVGAVPTGSARANATIVDTQSNALLWANRANCLTKVKRSSLDAISSINYQFGRTFPFRNRDF